MAQDRRGSRFDAAAQTTTRATHMAHLRAQKGFDLDWFCDQPIHAGAANFDEAALLDEFRAIHADGGFGSIIGRNSFQRQRPAALEMLRAAMDIYATS
jgi:hypothetical protein